MVFFFFANFSSVRTEIYTVWPNVYGPLSLVRYLLAERDDAIMLL